MAKLRAQAMADRIRWPLWLPVALGGGVGAYFALPVEPAWIWAPAALGLAVVLAVVALRLEHGRIICALLAASALGFGVAKLHTETVRAPVLAGKIGPVRFDARVVEAEPRGNGSRMLLEPV